MLESGKIAKFLQAVKACQTHDDYLAIYKEIETPYQWTGAPVPDVFDDRFRRLLLEGFVSIYTIYLMGEVDIESSHVRTHLIEFRKWYKFLYKRPEERLLNAK